MKMRSAQTAVVVHSNRLYSHKLKPLLEQLRVSGKSMFIYLFIDLFHTAPNSLGTSVKGEEEIRTR